MTVTVPPSTSASASGSWGPFFPTGDMVEPPAEVIKNARIFVAEGYTGDAGRVLAFHRGVFRLWDGRAWPEFPDGEAEAAVWRFFENAEYIGMGRNGPEQRRFRPNKSKVANLVEALRAVTIIGTNVEMPSWLGGDELVPPGDVIPMRNGLLHVPTRSVLPSTPAFFNGFAVPFDFNLDAEAPKRWLRFLDELWPDDAESKGTIQEVMGYLLTADTSQQKIVLLVGPKRSGKGTIARVTGGLVGRHNVAGPTLASFGQNFGLQSLIDRPVAIIPDARLGGRTDSAVVTERLLTISGEDTISVDRKYKSQWIGKLPTRLVIITNEVPALSDTSGALASRFLVLRTTESFYGKEDLGLAARLLAELPGILLWALDGLDRLTDRGYFVQPASSVQVIGELEDLASPVMAFVAECCDVGPEYEAPLQVVYEAWRAWCEMNGRIATNRQTFGRDLRAVHTEIQTTQRRIGGNRERVYRGLRLRLDLPPLGSVT